MAERRPLGPDSDPRALFAEITRQNKVVEALMNRLERNAAGDYRSEFDELQTAVALQREVRRRTADLEAALAENEQITRQLRDSELKLRSVIDQPLVGISIAEDGRFTFANRKLADMFGYQAGELVGRDILDVVTERDRPMVAEQMRQRLSGEVPVAHYTFRGLCKDGTEIDIELHGSVQTIGVKPVAVTVMLDVSLRKQAERRAEELHALLREQSIRDALTGLYNRRHFDASLAREIDRARAAGAPLGVVLCDIDHFKAVNDRYGHPVGDEVLGTIAAEIRQCCGADDLAFRLGGEEFLVLLPGRTVAAASAWADGLRRSLAAQVVGAAHEALSITASFGVAGFPHHGEDATTIVDLADRALYAAKRAGRNQVHTASLVPADEAPLRLSGDAA